MISKNTNVVAVLESARQTGNNDVARGRQSYGGVSSICRDAKVEVYVQAWKDGLHATGQDEVFRWKKGIGRVCGVQRVAAEERGGERDCCGR